METCPHCGSRHVKSIIIEQRTAFVCQLCGEYSGHPDAEAALADRREANSRHLDETVYPLVKRLEMIPGLSVTSASGGDADLLIPPFITFTCDPARWPGLEKLLIALRNVKDTRARWIIQATLQPKLAFELKPDFTVLPYALRREDLQGVGADIAKLQQMLERDMKLAWWNA